MNRLATVLPKFVLENRLESHFTIWRKKFGEHPIAVELWNGKRFTLGEPSKLVLRINSKRALERLMRPSLASLGTAYVEGELDFEGHMRDAFHTVAGFLSSLYQPNQRRRVRKTLHTRQLDSASIEHHYDVSNDFYRLWLDENMVYSCAYFRSADDSLEQAQVQKINHILNKIQLRPGERLLDIGCGWGALVLQAARQYGARCVGITLSRQQFEEASRRVHAAGLQGRCEIRLQDYRDVAEEFDKITSVGMFRYVRLTYETDSEDLCASAGWRGCIEPRHYLHRP
ncbi:MAG: class I SAM-dependent methyltransferase [Propionivibrio sp.]|nr:class I SAM-dependent methyltransferase [Propionivibrio sp.]